MTGAVDAAARPRLGSRLAALSVGQIISFYYALIVAAPRISEDTGWSLATIMLALAGGLIASAVAGIPVGSWLDERSPRLVMVLGGLIGTGQVIGRLIYVAIPHAAAPWAPLAATAALSAVMLALVAQVPGPPWLLIAVGIGAGAVRGAQTLVQGSAVADRWGTRNYGSINGIFAAPITITAALGPALGPITALATAPYALVAIGAACVAATAVIAAHFS